jgi:phosphate transport system ATP-binding protein
MTSSEGTPPPEVTAEAPPAPPVTETETETVVPDHIATDAPTGLETPAPPAPGDEPPPMHTTDVNAFFNKHHAIQNINLTFPPNTVTALIGPSGCGKSTFIRCLNRMHELVPLARMEGSVFLHGNDIYGKEADPVAIRRGVGMVFQRPNPFPTKSIADNIKAGPKFSRVKMSKDEREHLVEKTLRGAGLWDEVKNRLNAPAGGLSGGQQQRLCIARALAVEPDVLLMDEPCSALDPQSTLRIEELIRELKDRVTIVIVTHNMQQAARVSDYTAFFTIENEGEPGRLVEFAPTEKIFSHPDNPRTEAYVTGRFG